MLTIHFNAERKKYSDIDFAAPVLVVQTGHKLMLLIANAKRGKLDLKAIGSNRDYSKLKLANQKKVEKATDYEIRFLPLIGLDLPCILMSGF